MSRENDRVEHRRKTVETNLLAGLSLHQIAEALEEPTETILEDARSILERWRREWETVSDSALDLRRLDRILAELWDKARDGDPQAISQVVRISAHAKISPPAIRLEVRLRKGFSTAAMAAPIQRTHMLLMAIKALMLDVAHEQVAVLFIANEDSVSQWMRRFSE